MTQKMFTKSVKVTTVKGFCMNEDNAPESCEFILGGHVDSKKATKEIRRDSDESFMFASLTHSADTYTMPLADFVANAVKVDAEGDTDEDAEGVEVETAEGE